MSGPIAWALVCAFTLGVVAGGSLAAALIVAVRLRISVSDRRRADEAVRRRYWLDERQGGE
jgi:hypothetical protein